MRPPGRAGGVADTAKFDYGKAAVIAYNMQKNNDGPNMPMRRIVSNVRALVDAAHEKGLPVFYGRHLSLPPEYMSEYYAYWQRELGENLDDYYKKYGEESRGTEIIDELKPTDQDIVVRKYNAKLLHWDECGDSPPQQGSPHHHSRRRRHRARDRLDRKACHVLGIHAGHCGRRCRGEGRQISFLLLGDNERRLSLRHSEDKERREQDPKWEVGCQDARALLR